MYIWLSAVLASTASTPPESSSYRKLKFTGGASPCSEAQGPWGSQEARLQAHFCCPAAPPRDQKRLLMEPPTFCNICNGVEVGIGKATGTALGSAGCAGMTTHGVPEMVTLMYSALPLLPLYSRLTIRLAPSNALLPHQDRSGGQGQAATWHGSQLSFLVAYHPRLAVCVSAVL